MCETFEQQQERKWRQQQAASVMHIPARSQHAPIQAHGLDTIGYDFQADTQLQMQGMERMKQRVMVDNFDVLFKQVRAHFPSSNAAMTGTPHLLVPSQGCSTCGPQQPVTNSSDVWLSEHKRGIAKAVIALLGVFAVSLIM